MSRSRDRIIPGPAGLDHALLQGDIGDSANVELPRERELLPFLSLPWITMCRSLGIETDVPHSGEVYAGASSANTELQLQTIAGNVRKVLKHCIRDVLDGICDLRIPHLAAIVEAVTHSHDGMWMITLSDPTGRINGYALPEVTKLHDGLLKVGSAIVLERVAIFVVKDPSESNCRILNLHGRCIVAVFKNDPSLQNYKFSEQQPSVGGNSCFDAHSRGTSASTPRQASSRTQTLSQDQGQERGVGSAYIPLESIQPQPVFWDDISSYSDIGPASGIASTFERRSID